MRSGRERTTSSWPTCVSSARSRCDTADCVIDSSCAARSKLPASASAASDSSAAGSSRFISNATVIAVFAMNLHTFPGRAYAGFVHETQPRRPPMKIGVPKEIKNHEYRVGLTPASVREFVAHGHSVLVQSGAGAAIGLDDAQYRTAGATLADGAQEVFAKSDMIVKVKEPQPQE